MDKLRFATAGIPLSTEKPNSVNGIKRVRELNLDAMEVEFVRSIYISKEKAPEIREIAKKEDVVLTCHSPYFINLNSSEKKKIYASINYIVQSCRIMSLCNGYSVCFHPGFYMKEDKGKVYETITKNVKEIVKKVKEFDDKIWIRPETTGKASAFGDYKEIIKMSKEVEQVMPCIDFSHVHARSGGLYNTKKEFEDILALVEKDLGREALDNMHMHIAGINYSEKGERNHLELEKSDMNYKDLLRTFKEFKLKGVVVCESPNIEKDAKLLKDFYENLNR